MSSLPTRVKLEFDPDFKRYPAIRNKLIQASMKMEEQVNTAQFKKAVLSHVYDGRPGFASCPYLPQTIYKMIMEGREKLDMELDHEWDFIIIPYYKNNSVVGYTYPNRKEIWINVKFHARYSVAQSSNNLTHEYCHKLGFGHDYRRTARRPHSVPYAVGRIMQSLVENSMAPTSGEVQETPVATSPYKHMSWYLRAWMRFKRIFF